MIKQARPDLADNHEIEMAAEQLDEAQGLANLAESHYGQALLTSKMKDASSLMFEAIDANRKGDALKSSIALYRLEALLNLIIELRGARQNADNLQKVVDELIQQE